MKNIFYFEMPNIPSDPYSYSVILPARNIAEIGEITAENLSELFGIKVVELKGVHYSREGEDVPAVVSFRIDDTVSLKEKREFESSLHEKLYPLY